MLKIGEMLKMLKLQKAKLQHFAGNVADVEDVEVAGEIFGRGGGRISLQLQHLQHFPGNVEVLGFLTSTSSTFPQFKHIFIKICLKIREMLKMLKLQKAKLLHFLGEMLKMLKLQGIFFGGGGSEFPPATSTSSTSSTFPGKC